MKTHEVVVINQIKYWNIYLPEKIVFVCTHNLVYNSSFLKLFQVLNMKLFEFYEYPSYNSYSLYYHKNEMMSCLSLNQKEKNHWTDLTKILHRAGWLVYISLIMSTIIVLLLF